MGYSVTDDPSCLERVLSSVADRENTVEADLPPLYDCVDPDALATLIEDAGTDVSVRFTYHGYDVEIDRTGRVRVDGSTDEHR